MDLGLVLGTNQGHKSCRHAPTISCTISKQKGTYNWNKCSLTHRQKLLASLHLSTLQIDRRVGIVSWHLVKFHYFWKGSCSVQERLCPCKEVLNRKNQYLFFEGRGYLLKPSMGTLEDTSGPTGACGPHIGEPCPDAYHYLKLVKEHTWQYCNRAEAPRPHKEKGNISTRGWLLGQHPHVYTQQKVLWGLPI